MLKELYAKMRVKGSLNSQKLSGFSLKGLVRSALPYDHLPQEVRDWRKDNLLHILLGMKGIVAARVLGSSHVLGTLHASKIMPLVPDSLLKELLEEYSAQYVPGLDFPFFLYEKGFKTDFLDYGLASTRVVTTVGVGFIVDAFQNSTELENMKYHGIGTDNTAEASSDTALIAELSTAYNPNSTRATGSTTEGASANIYRTIGTNTVDSGVAIVEHGIFSQAATGGGVLFDRSIFSAINLASGDSLQTTYDATFSAGG